MKTQKPWFRALRVTLYIIFIEALLTWGFFSFRGLWQAVKTADARYTNTRIYVHTHAAK